MNACSPALTPSASIKRLDFRRIFLAGLILASAAGSERATAETNDCAPAGALQFICGAEKPEDLKRIPGTPFLVASGFAPGSGLKLVNMRTKSLSRWFSASPDQLSLDAQHFTDCAAPPDPASFNARGLSLRRTGRHKARLHVVNHGGRELIEIFDISWAGKDATPALTWRGCLLLPQDHVGNAVATYSDGTVLVSVLTRPGTTITDFERGKATGGIFERTPGDPAFRLIPGTALPGNNGLETARDDHGFYTVAFGLRAVAVFARGGTTGPEAVIPAPGFMPDNIHWDGARLIAAGMNSDEPACGGKRQIINGIADKMLCPRGWKVAALNPAKGTFRVIAEGPRVPSFNGISQALLVGQTLWLGSYQADRLAYRRLGRPKFSRATGDRSDQIAKLGN